jgi:starch synthase (maltosyl-transferring)
VRTAFKIAIVKGQAEQIVEHIIIERVTPCLDCGRWPIKRIMGDRLTVEADIFRDGHQILRAVLKWRLKRERDFLETAMTELGNDRWSANFVLQENARYVFTIEAWTDRFASWRSDLEKKVRAGHDVRSDLLEGAAILDELARAAKDESAGQLSAYISALKQSAAPRALEVALSPALASIAARLDPRSDAVTYEPVLEVVADRPKARFSAWYEMFPRSQGNEPGKPASFRVAERRLSDISKMGFDVLYLAPIHPIGVTHRKGPNNSLKPLPDSPGSPWAIGSSAGGHTAIDPALGTIDDFEHFVAASRQVGLEVALDFAIQCSPDHPWVREHPEWFNHRPDGTIKYAENPPKEYQDIYPLNFDTVDQEGLKAEMRRVLLFWIDHGVRIFRVDNPHTKPVSFWKWLIEEIQNEHPDVIFLSEAFTRPKMMKALAKAGFTQSYTYFTWRNNKNEMIEYLTELTQTEMAEYFRPNFFTNTPDILSPILQTGGRPAFQMRLVLAATLSPSFGIYSGYELCENEAIPGTEEYLNSEKYEIKVRDWNRPGNIKDFISRVNAIRRENPALQQLTNLRFLPTDNEHILLYAKSTADLSNVILVAVNMDPFSTRECTATVPCDAVGVAPGRQYRVADLLTGMSYIWSERNYVRLDPHMSPAHILRVEERL